MTSRPPTNTEQFILARIEFQNHMVKTQHWMSCLNCVYFKDETCTMFKMRPPAHIIVSGCKDYLDDIPF